MWNQEFVWESVCWWERQVLLQTVLWNVWWSLCDFQSVWEGEGPKEFAELLLSCKSLPQLKVSLRSLPLKATATSHCVFSLGVFTLINLLTSLFFQSLLMKLMLTHSLRRHTLTDSADWNGCCLAPLMVLLSWCPTGPWVVSDVFWRTAWHCISWAPGWDEVSKQDGKCDFKAVLKPACC